MVEGIPKFVFDPAKSAANRRKHGIDFEEAQAVWADDNRLEIAALEVDEARFAVIGRIGEKYWTVIVTYREGAVRIISARRSRDVEIAGYEG